MHGLHIRRTQTIHWLMLSVIFLTGCATTKITQMYPGPARLHEEIARIVCESGAGQLTVLTEVDGRPVGSSPISGEHVICVLPGEHHLAFYWKCYDSPHAAEMSFRDTDGQLAFTAQAGNFYTLRSRDLGNRVHFWIEDQKGRDVSVRKSGE
jgi:hypothetical protein